jgi:GDP-4-dehydro-6-deoxy-D-mannose reductase
VNVLGLVALLEAVRAHAPQAAVVTAGSAAEYGLVSQDRLPVTEDCPCAPVSAYGQSKLAATQIALMYRRVHGLSATVVRPFQLLGQGVTTRLAPGAFAEQLRQALAAGGRVIRVGNLASERDFLDVADAVEGLWALCRHPAPGETFNLCSGQPTKMSDLLQLMIDVSRADVTVEIDPARLRGAADVSSVYGSFEKLHRYCGWRPRRSLEESVQGMLGSSAGAQG